MSLDPRSRELLAHFLAGLAYRTQKALRGAPPEYATYQAAPGVRTPWQLLHHMSGVLSYATSMFEELDPWIEPCDTFDEEVARFHAVLGRLTEHLEGGAPESGTTAERLLQGPFSDSMTHAGQLAMLRRLSGHPIPPENFHAADITAGTTGQEQPQPVSPDEVWLDADGRDQKVD